MSELFQESKPELVDLGPVWSRLAQSTPPSPQTKTLPNQVNIEKVPVQRGSPLKSTHQRSPVLTIRLKLITHVTSSGKWIIASHCLF